MNVRGMRIPRIAWLAIVLATAPVQVTPDGGIAEQQACAQSGTCCPEPESTCVIGSFSRADAYYKAEGSCRNQK